VVAGIVLIGNPLAATDKQQEAEALLTRARELSLLRRDGGTPFHLKMSFKFWPEESRSLDGTYEEIWASPDRWRDEITLADFKQVRVGGKNKIFIWRNGDFEPLAAFRLIGLLHQFQELRVTADYAVVSVGDDERDHTQVQWVILRNKGKGYRNICFDSSSGALREDSRGVEKTVIGSYVYLDYFHFGDALFPRVLRALDDRRVELEAHVEKLERAENVDVALFQPGDGVERVTCEEPEEPRLLRMDPPRALATATKALKHPATVVLYVLVSPDGRVTKVATLKSSGIQDIDTAMESTVKKGIFKPAMCGATPVETEVPLELGVGPH
jgi:TonB family protein